VRCRPPVPPSLLEPEPEAADDGEPHGCLNDAPCPPFARHGAAINTPCGAGGESGGPGGTVLPPPPIVSGAWRGVASCLAAVLTEISLCNACSCPEIFCVLLGGLFD
jgi:hypothetical protein